MGIANIHVTPEAVWVSGTQGRSTPFRCKPTLSKRRGRRHHHQQWVGETVSFSAAGITANFRIFATSAGMSPGLDASCRLQGNCRAFSQSSSGTISRHFVVIRSLSRQYHMFSTDTADIIVDNRESEITGRPPIHQSSRIVPPSDLQPGHNQRAPETRLQRRPKGSVALPPIFCCRVHHHLARSRMDITPSLTNKSAAALNCRTPYSQPRIFEKSSFSRAFCFAGNPARIPVRSRCSVPRWGARDRVLPFGDVGEGRDYNAQNSFRHNRRQRNDFVVSSTSMSEQSPSDHAIVKEGREMPRAEDLRQHHYSARLFVEKGS